MKLKWNNNYVRWGITAFVVIAASIIFYYFVFHSSNIVAGLRRLTDILMPLVFGLATAYLLTPVLNTVEKKFLIPIFDKLEIKESKKRRSVIRGLGVFLTAFLFIALIYLLFYMVISQLVPSIQNIIENFDKYRGNVVNRITSMLERPESANAV